MDLIIVNSKEKADKIISKLNKIMGYPNPETETETYTEAISHESLKGNFMIPIKSIYAPKLDRKISADDILKELTVDEKSLKKTYIQLKDDNAFKTGLEV